MPDSEPIENTPLTGAPNSSCTNPCTISCTNRTELAPENAPATGPATSPENDPVTALAVLVRGLDPDARQRLVAMLAGDREQG